MEKLEILDDFDISEPVDDEVIVLKLKLYFYIISYIYFSY
jgi:hypothetical protein